MPVSKQVSWVQEYIDVRKGTTCILKIGFPTPPRERRVAVEKYNVKDNKEYHDPPEEGLPQPAPQQNVEEEDISLKQYYQIGISSLEGQIASVDNKLAAVISDPDTSPANARKIARKLGRGQKYLESVKANVAYLEEVEASEELLGMAVALEEQEAATVAAAQYHQQGGAWPDEPIAEDLVELDGAAGSLLEESGAASPALEASAEAHGAGPEPIQDN